MNNFRIFVHHNSDNTHLKLIGDFDGSSATQLIDVLKEKCCDARKVIIHTNCLENVFPCGLDEFRENFNMINGGTGRILFTGDKKVYLNPIA